MFESCHPDQVFREKPLFFKGFFHNLSFVLIAVISLFPHKHMGNWSFE